MGLGNIFERIADAITGNDNEPQTVDNNAPDVLPASQDPLGDPADGAGYANTANNSYNTPDVLPASEDPLGDPADDPQNAGAFNTADVLPASEDPLGDPADQRA